MKTEEIKDDYLRLKEELGPDNPWTIAAKDAYDMIKEHRQNPFGWNLLSQLSALLDVVENEDDPAMPSPITFDRVELRVRAMSLENEKVCCLADLNHVYKRSTFD